MYKPQKPKTGDIVILALAIGVIVVVEAIACGVAGWNFYHYVMRSEAAPTVVEVSQTAVPAPTDTSTPTLALTKSTEVDEVRPTPGVTLTLSITPTVTATFTATLAAPKSAGADEVEPIPTLPAVDFVPVPGEKWILIDLSEQKLWAYEGATLFLESFVSTGTDAHPTVVGEYRIYIKLVAARMTGPGYDLPNVPFTMYFYRGYGVHGTYWHDNVGYPMSHGCINLPTPVAEKLFWWADPVLPEGANAVWATEENPGTLVVIQP